MNKCDICIKNIETVIKCNECTFNACKECILNWYESSIKNSCPQCRTENSYNVEYIRSNPDDLLLLIPMFLGINTNELVSSSVLISAMNTGININFNHYNNHIFDPENFLMFYNNTSPEFKEIWYYEEITMTIDEITEIIGYKLVEN